MLTESLPQIIAQKHYELSLRARETVVVDALKIDPDPSNWKLVHVIEPLNETVASCGECETIVAVHRREWQYLADDPAGYMALHGVEIH